MIRVSLCQRNKSRGILTWYVRIFDTETKEIRYESLSTTKKTEAKDLMLAKQASGDFAVKKKSQITLGKVVELYLKDCESRGSNAISLNTISHSLDSIKSLFDTPIEDITKMSLLSAFNESASGFKATTYNNTKTTIRTAFRFAKDVLEVIDSSPADCLKSRKNTQKERDFWTMEQIDRILDATTSKTDRLLFSLMAFAGLRVHEALKLKKEDLKDGYLTVIGKGGKFAKIPISSRLKSELDRAERSFDFDKTRSGLTYSLEVASKKALGSFPGSANLHRFRHSFASNLIRSGVGVKSVQKLMRHSNIQTTLNIYSHLIDEDLVEDIEKMFRNT